ncbi:MAG: alpha/beta hydrolase fold domain-containing protein [Devosia sp.]
MAILVGHKGTASARGAVANDLAHALDAAEKAQSISAPDEVLSVSAYRAWFDDYARVIAPPSIRPACDVENIVIEASPANIHLRVYNPPKIESVIVFAHGGAWMMGSVETHDHICRWLATATDSRVISVEYALAPEHPFPFAAAQLAHVIRTVLAQRILNDGRRVFVAGDSAGANVASMGLLRLDTATRQRVAGFVSIYGAYSPSMDLSSHALFADGRFGLSRQTMMWCWNLYAPHLSAAERQQISPLGARTDYFPPTLCIGAECDLLIDDTLAFYSDLARIGTDVSLSLWHGVTHGALHFVGLVDSVTAAAHSIVEFVASHRKVHNSTATHSPMGRLLASAENGEHVQLPFLPADAHLTLENPVSIRTPHLMPRSRLHGSLAHKLGSDIIKGVHPPGAVIVAEGEDGTGPGRSSYREAVRTLAAKGLVVATPKVGTKVAPRSAWRLLDPDILAWHFESRLDERFLRDAFELRKVTEPSAAALTALRMTQQLKTSMASALADMTGHRPGTPEWHQGQLTFHELVLLGGENELLGALWPSTRVILEWASNFRRGSGHIETDDDAASAYATAFAKIASGDAEGAMITMAHLIDMNLNEALTVLLRGRSTSTRRTAVEIS